ncbi:MAG: response regulator transcription factor [Bacteroidetes bacterium]|nr:response regulator transcription factor [Bacteroidota bacterium]
MDSKGIKVLVADDEPDILEIVRYKLEAEGYEVATASNGEEALQKARSVKPDLIILDVMMPFRTGMDVCRMLRSDTAFHDTLILMLTALNDELSQVRGLEYGADDYINKPVSPRVLISRVHALLRRKARNIDEAPIQLESLRIDPTQFSVHHEGQAIALAKKEFELLYLLASRPRRVFLRNEILSHVWGPDVIVGDRTIDVHIRKIRQKLGIDCIRTVKGVGYKFEM